MDANRSRENRVRKAETVTSAGADLAIALPGGEQTSLQQVASALEQPVTFSYGDFMKHYTNQLALPMPILVNLDESQVSRLLEHSVNPRGHRFGNPPYAALSLSHGRRAHSRLLAQDNRSFEGEVADFISGCPITAATSG
jgi:hypothetical protein